MPTIFGYGFGGLVDAEPSNRRVPGVNQGRKRGVTKSPKPRRKR